MQEIDDRNAVKRPTIGILTSILLKNDTPFLGLERSYVNHDYITAIEAAGGVPILLPVVEQDDTVIRQIDSVDAILLSGGYDPNPLLYGENPTRRIDFIYPEVDEHQLKAIRCASAAGKPILGICRGLQILNIAFGGTLYQDLSLIPNSYVQHQQKSRKHSAGHQVSIVAKTMLAEIFGATEIVTNSFHHLAVREVAPGFVASAFAVDGVIEGIEKADRSPVMAVQWHPEMMWEKDPSMLALFSRFVDVARSASASRWQISTHSR